MNENNTPPKPSQIGKGTWVAMAILFITGFFAFLHLHFKRLNSPLLFKQEIADKYGISRKVLNRWIKLFFDEKTANKLSKQKRIRLYDLESILGKPQAVISSNGKVIITKSDIERSLEISSTTLSRFIAKSQNLKADILLSPKEYKSINNFPPQCVEKILNLCKKVSCKELKR